MPTYLDVEFTAKVFGNLPRHKQAEMCAQLAQGLQDSSRAAPPGVRPLMLNIARDWLRLAELIRRQNFELVRANREAPR